MYIVLRILATIFGTVVLSYIGLQLYSPGGIREFANRPTGLQLVAPSVVIGAISFVISLMISVRFIRQF